MTISRPKRVGVIGAGPAGLTAALMLRRGGADVDLYEASANIGGLSRTIELWGQRVDIGPHRFYSTDPRINQFWLDVVGENYAMVHRMTRVFFRGKLIDYPIRPLAAMRQLGWIDAAKCLSSYLAQKVKPSRTRDDESFESWVTSRFGRRLFELFFRSYSEKLWGIPCTELSADFAAQRIREFSLGEAMLSAVSQRRADRHKTLADTFAYPIGGTGTVYEAMANEFCQLGGRIHLNCSVRRVIHDNRRVRSIVLDSDQTMDLDHLVSTMPLSLLIEAMDDHHHSIPPAVSKAANDLKFRNTLLIYLHVDSDRLFDDQWLYIQSPEVRVGRVTNFRNWTSDLYGDSKTTILAIERWCNRDDPAWSDSDRDLISECTGELRSIGLLNQETVLDGHVIRINRSYPVYSRGYHQHIDQIAEYLSSLEGITPIGRNGSFKYNNQDHSILMGLLAAENVLHGGCHDLWKLNSDFGDYQERTKITETGLVPMPTVS